MKNRYEIEVVVALHTITVIQSKWKKQFETVVIVSVVTFLPRVVHLWLLSVSLQCAHVRCVCVCVHAFNVFMDSIKMKLHTTGSICKLGAQAIHNALIVYTDTC